MKNRIIKTLVIIIILVVFSTPIVKVYAQSPLLDIISLARVKVAAIVEMTTGEESTDIENKANSVENDILNYIDLYIKGLENDLKDYATQERIQAENNLEQEYLNIKADLESQREELLQDGKENIKDKIDKKYEEEYNKLIEKLNEELTKKFN